MKLFQSKKLRLTTGLIITALLFTGLVWIAFAPRQPHYKTPVVITHSTDKPHEDPPPKNYEWPGGPTDPKRIQLPTIGVDGFVQQVGVDQDKQIAVPDNIHMAGWFVNSVRPGQKGLSIIDGHVDGREQEGIFYRLENIKKEDEFHIELGNGEIKRFKVLKVETVATKDAPGVLFSQQPNVVSQLNLVTCGGTFDKTSRQYDKRVIVTAVLL